MATQLIPAAAAITVPCVVFALRRESMYFRRAYRFQKRFPGAPCPADFRGRFAGRCREPGGTTGPARLAGPTGEAVLMLETGVGADAMETALGWCLSEPHFGGVPYRPRLLISVGFSGALQPEQHVGDLVLATEIVDAQGNTWPTFCPKALANRNIPAGRVLTMPEMVGDPREKQRLGQQYQTVAVDMESAIAARLCAQHNVPFACLRVISDDWETALSPQLMELLRQGRVSVPRLAATVLRHPKLISELWRLAAQTRLAARQLSEPLAAVFLGGDRAGDGG
jgi:adenosylhomocysteine nucleosidase